MPAQRIRDAPKSNRRVPARKQCAVDVVMRFTQGPRACRQQSAWAGNNSLILCTVLRPTSPRTPACAAYSGVSRLNGPGPRSVNIASAVDALGARDGDDEAGWSLVVALQSFDASKKDIALLAGQAFRDSGWDSDLEATWRSRTCPPGSTGMATSAGSTPAPRPGSASAVLARGRLALLSRRDRPAHALAVHRRAGHCPRRALVAVARASPWHDSRPP
jgi:hypothetical protein